MKTKDILKKLAFMFLFLEIMLVVIIGYIVITGYIIQWNIQQKKDNEIFCGGLGGVGCPSGYYCRTVTYSNHFSIWDAGGVCKRGDPSKDTDCLSTKEVGVVCGEY
jgi:hypothetical protein